MAPAAQTESATVGKDDFSFCKGHLEILSSFLANLHAPLACSSRSLDHAALRPTKLSQRIFVRTDFSKHVRECTEVVDDARGQVFEQRQQLVANAYSGKSWIGIRGIFRTHEFVPANMCHDVTATSSDHRTNQVARLLRTFQNDRR